MRRTPTITLRGHDVTLGVSDGAQAETLLREAGFAHVEPNGVGMLRVFEAQERAGEMARVLRWFDFPRDAPQQQVLVLGHPEFRGINRVETARRLDRRGRRGLVASGRG